MNRRNFLHTALAALAIAVTRKWHDLTRPKRKELDAIDAMDYCADDGKMSMAGMDGERSSIWRSDWGSDWGSGDEVTIWHEVGTAPREGRITAIFMMDSDRWFIGYEDGELWETDDAGETWERQEYELIGGAA